MQKLRKLHKLARDAHGSDYPFCRVELKTDGIDFFEKVYDQDGGSVLYEFGKPQLVIEKIVGPVLVDLIYEDDGHGMVSAWRPSEFEGVTIQPGLRLGKPTIETCGIPTSTLNSVFQANNHDAEYVAWWFGVNVRDVEQAVHYEQAEQEAAAA